MSKNYSLSLSIICALLAACGGGSRTPATPSPQETASAEPPALESTPPPPDTPALAAARAIDARGFDGALEEIATQDVDGDGALDYVFGAAAAEVGCVLVRGREGEWEASIIDAPFGPSPAESACLPPIGLEGGGALLVVYNDTGIPTAVTTWIGLHEIRPGGEPTLVHQELSPFTATWTFTALDAERVALTATIGEPTIGYPHITKVIRHEPEQGWVAASCWAEQPPNPENARSCTVTLSESMRIRRLEGDTFGMPAFVGPAPVLEVGRPGRNAGAPRSWCVLLPDGTTRWVELPASETRACTAP